MILRNDVMGGGNGSITATQIFEGALQYPEGAAVNSSGPALPYVLQTATVEIDKKNLE